MTKHPEESTGPPEETGGVERDILRLLARSGWEDPAGQVTPEEQRRLAARAEADLARIMAQAPHSSSLDVRETVPRKSRRGPSRRWAGLAAAVLVAVVAGGLVLVEPWGSGREAVASTPPPLEFDEMVDTTHVRGGPAAEALEVLAEAARAQPPDVGPEGASVHAVSIYGWWLNTIDSRSVMDPVHVQTYVRSDGVMRLIERRGDPLDEAGTIDRALDLEALERVADEVVTDAYPGPHDLAAVPRDPEGLIAWLATDDLQCREAASCLARQAFNWNETLVVDPALMATVWEALAGFDEVEFLGATTDRIGREVWGLAMDATDSHRRLILLADPETGRLVGVEEILTRDDARLGLEAPVVTEFTAIESARLIRPEDIPQ